MLPSASLIPTSWQLHILQVKALANTSGIRGMLISETGGRPSQPYCEAVQDAAAAHAGFFLWALMIGADQFGPPLSPGSPPFQGLVYPNGSWYDPAEELLCIRSPSRVVLYSDTDTEALSYTTRWATWVVPGQSRESCVRTYGPRFCTLHFARSAGATMSFVLPAWPHGVDRRQVYLYYKTGSDCGTFDLVAGTSRSNSSATTVDTYAPATETGPAARWDARMLVLDWEVPGVRA